MDIFSHSQAILLPALLTGALFIAVLGCIADGSGFFAKAIQWLRKDPLVRVLLIVGLFSTGPITSRSKNGAPLRIAPTSQTSGAMAPFVCHEASTNGVTMVEPTTNAVVSQACLLHGASEAGEWLESAKPFFRWGTNDIRRLYASPGCLSFGTKRHPYLGDTLPNGTPAESLVVLRTPLGIVPEANWHLLEGTGVVSRFWHDALPGGGRVFTWENALLDRLSDRPATIQAELRPNGDFVYRYDFSHSAPTNAFLVGSQKAAAAVEALRTGNAETNSATVYRLDGDTATNGVPIADFFATAPLLELRWKNTSGLGDLSGDTDGDDLTDWDEVFLHGTDLTIDDLTSEGLTQIGSRFGLRLPSSPGSAATGTILLGAKKLRWGYYQYEVSAHRLLSGLNGTHCAICDNEGIHIDDVSLAVRSPLTLKHDNEAVVSFHCEQAGHGSATNPEIKIRRVGTSQWYTLAQSFHYDWTARIAGFFELKGVATLDGATVETSPAEVEVRLPSYSDIANDYTVLVLGQNLWSKVLEDCSENGRREHGCWIALDSTTGMYFGTSFRTGEWATASTTPGVSLPLKGFYDGESGIPPPTGTGAVYPVATIHAHTPTTYTVSGREVGPSGQDQGNSLLLAAPGIVLDYLPALDAVHPMATNRIPSGHPMESPYRLYPVIPPDRRPTPP